jgi:NADP-dependent 3-hydroxy acid dehydrogenase YdfG
MDGRTGRFIFRRGFLGINEITMTGALREKVAVITGASSGIGLAVAKELYSYGMKLVLAASREDTLPRLKSELQAAILPGNVCDARGV